MSTSTRAPGLRRGPLPRPATLRMPSPRWLLTDGGVATLVAVLCVALAVVSVAALPSVPSFDPFAWIVWGSEIAHHLTGTHQPLVLQGGPSWKPLPVLFTTLFGLAGSSAVTLWMIFARACGLFGLFLAYRVAARLCAEDRPAWAGPLAGTLAAVAVCLTERWFNDMLRTTSEPITITATLWWAERHLAGRRLWAFAAGVALALMRPESVVLLALYAAWCLWRGPGLRERVLVSLGMALIPSAWVLPPWLAAGKPLQSSGHARAYAGNRGHDLATIALTRTENLLVIWAVGAALALVVLALVRRERAVLGLAGAAVAYVAVIEAMTIAGYPGLARFMLPAAAIVAVLGGVGVVRIAELAGSRWSLALAAGLLAAAVPLSISSVASAGSADRVAALAVQSSRDLSAAVGRAGGARAVLPCQRSLAAVNHKESTDLAWMLGVPLTRVRGVTTETDSLREAALAFFAARTSVLGGAPRHLTGTLHERRGARVRMWRISRITRAGRPRIDACVGW